MKITGYEGVTRDQLLSREDVLKEVIYNGRQSQIQLKDGIYTVGSLMKLSNTNNVTWGA